MNRSFSSRVDESIRESFRRLLSTQRSHGLITALVNLIGPAGVPESAGVVGKLCARLLHIAESNEIESDAALLPRMGVVAAWAEGEMRDRAARLALEAARRLGRQAAIRAWERTVSGGDVDSRTPAGRLQSVERDLQEFPFAFDDDSEPELAAKWTRVGLRIERASLLMDLGRYREAGDCAREILRETQFPASGVAEDAWIVDYAGLVWKLHGILGSLAIRAGDFQEAESRFCQAIDVLWRELDFGISVQYYSISLPMSGDWTVNVPRRRWMWTFG